MKKRDTSQQDFLTQADNAHLQRPHPSDPDLELALHARNVLELNALPPAAPGGLAPEEQQLLGHTHGIGAHLVTADVTAEARKCKTADDGLVGLTCAVTPGVVMVKASVKSVSNWQCSRVWGTRM